MIAAVMVLDTTPPDRLLDWSTFGLVVVGFLAFVATFRLARLSHQQLKLLREELRLSREREAVARRRALPWLRPGEPEVADNGNLADVLVNHVRGTDWALGTVEVIVRRGTVHWQGESRAELGPGGHVTVLATLVQDAVDAQALRYPPGGEGRGDQEGAVVVRP
jgi:hypothetical protein